MPIYGTAPQPNLNRASVTAVIKAGVMDKEMIFEEEHNWHGVFCTTGAY